MPQKNTSSIKTGVEESIALIEQEGKAEDWFFKLALPAVVLLFIVGSIILLS